MKREYGQDSGDGPTAAPGPCACQSLAHCPEVTSRVGHRQKRSAYFCRSASLNAYTVGGVSLMRSPCTFERLEERVGAIAPAPFL